MSDNMFKEILTNSKATDEKYIGQSQNYPYYKYIRTPSEMGMSNEGSLSALENNINGLVGYVDLLVSSRGEASSTGEPLGNKFFYKTGAKCKDILTKLDVDRYIYVNNVPQKNIPIVSSGMGIDFTEFKGLIPGTINSINNINPMEMFQAFFTGSKPDCQEINMETIDIYNNKSTESHYVTLIDIKNMNPCLFSDKQNPVTGEKCTEKFTNLNQNNDDYPALFKIPEDSFSQLYFASVGLLGVYILYGVMVKNGMLPIH
jgi:hypothetical protein